VRRLKVTADTLFGELGPPLGTPESNEARHSLCDMRSHSSRLTGPLSLTSPRACSPPSTTKQRLGGNGCSGEAPRARITGHGPTATINGPTVITSDERLI